MEQSRRNLLGFATGGALLPFAVSQTAEAHPPRSINFMGVSVSIRWSGQWEVAVPASLAPSYVGEAIALKWMPLNEFTAQIEHEMREARVAAGY